MRPYVHFPIIALPHPQEVRHAKIIACHSTCKQHFPNIIRSGAEIHGAHAHLNWTHSVMNEKGDIENPVKV